MLGWNGHETHASQLWFVQKCFLSAKSVKKSKYKLGAPFRLLWRFYISNRSLCVAVCVCVCVLMEPWTVETYAINPWDTRFFHFRSDSDVKRARLLINKMQKNSIKCAEVSNENLLKICVCTGRWIWCSRWELVFLHTNWCARQWEKQNHGTTSIAAVWIDTPKSHMRIHTSAPDECCCRRCCQYINRSDFTESKTCHVSCHNVCECQPLLCILSSSSVADVVVLLTEISFQEYFGLGYVNRNVCQVSSLFIIENWKVIEQFREIDRKINWIQLTWSAVMLVIPFPCTDGISKTFKEETEVCLLSKIDFESNFIFLFRYFWNVNTDSIMQYGAAIHRS